MWTSNARAAAPCLSCLLGVFLLALACSDDPDPAADVAVTDGEGQADTALDVTVLDVTVLDVTVDVAPTEVDTEVDSAAIPDAKATDTTVDAVLPPGDSTADVALADAADESDAVDVTDDATLPADATSIADAEADGQGGDSLQADADPADGGDTVAPPVLPLPACAANCLDCYQCAKAPVCVDGQTYASTCHAICALQAVKWPGAHVVETGACFVSTCKLCTKQDVKAPHCATLKDGSQVAVNMACEAKCLVLDGSVQPNPVPGPCLTPCTKAVGLGGAGCLPGEFNPVCSATDGQSYISECAMQHCDVKGCFPMGAPGKTSACVPFAMKSACAGQCWDKSKWPGCPDTCAPVCRFDAAGKGVSYRNSCIAKAEKALPGSCEGTSASKYDKCSVELYDKLGVGCCPGVDYAVVKQVCASTGTGKDEAFYTFRSLKEYACLSKNKKMQWKFQFQGPCLCNCTKMTKPVCGTDGKTYQNLCQAKCHGGPDFKATPGACGGG